MSIDFDVYAVAPALPLGEAARRVLERWTALGFRMVPTAFGATEDQDVEAPLEGEWSAAVNAWPWVALWGHREGPSIGVILEPAGPGALGVSFTMSFNLMRKLLTEGREDGVFAPVLEALSVLGARVAAGDPNWDFEPASEEEVAAAFARDPYLAFVRKDLDARPATPEEYVAREHPAGFTVFQNEDLVG